MTQTRRHLLELAPLEAREITELLDLAESFQDISHRRIITYSLDNLDELDKNITSVIKSELGYGD